MRILIADDNKDAAESLAILMSLGDHEVMVVRDGSAAVDAMREWEPDIAVHQDVGGLQVAVQHQAGVRVHRRAHTEDGCKPDRATQPRSRRRSNPHDEVDRWVGGP